MGFWLLVLTLVIGAALFAATNLKKQDLKIEAKTRSRPQKHRHPTRADLSAPKSSKAPSVTPAKNPENTNPPKLRPKKIMNNPERVLYYRLKLALPEHEVIPQAPFSQFLKAKGGAYQENRAHYARARQKVADFLICTKQCFPLAVVELDGKHHNHEKDAYRDSLLREAGIPTYRWPINPKNPHGPSDDELQKLAATLASD